jgi:hypothetical protein
MNDISSFRNSSSESARPSLLNRAACPRPPVRISTPRLNKPQCGTMTPYQTCALRPALRSAPPACRFQVLQHLPQHGHERHCRRNFSASLPSRNSLKSSVVTRSRHHRALRCGHIRPASLASPASGESPRCLPPASKRHPSRFVAHQIPKRNKLPTLLRSVSSVGATFLPSPASPSYPLIVRFQITVSPPLNPSPPCAAYTRGS